jgi:uncharacterized protein (TIGR03382 family)
MILSGNAEAAYTGVSVSLYSTVSVSGVNRSVFRVYANFDNGGDRLFSWGGGTANPVTIQSSAGNFFNPGGVSNTAPSLAQINGTTNTPAIPNITWGTFATIGVSIANQGNGAAGGSFPDTGTGDLTQLSPGFPNFINGASVTYAGATFLTGSLPGDAQNRADYAPDGDGALRVLMMQLTVNQGSQVSGTLGSLVWLPAGQANSVTVPGLTFTSIIPAPGAMALLGLAGLVGSRRRRA